MEARRGLFDQNCDDLGQFVDEFHCSRDEDSLGNGQERQNAHFNSGALDVSASSVIIFIVFELHHRGRLLQQLLLCGEERQPESRGVQETTLGILDVALQPCVVDDFTHAENRVEVLVAGVVNGFDHLVDFPAKGEIKHDVVGVQRPQEVHEELVQQFRVDKTHTDFLYEFQSLLVYEGGRVAQLRDQVAQHFE